jgi:hypothetical protein
MERRRILPDEQPMREPREMLQRYRELFPPTCEAKGCTSDAERDEMFCSRHQLTDAF